MQIYIAIHFTLHNMQIEISTKEIVVPTIKVKSLDFSALISTSFQYRSDNNVNRFKRVPFSQ